MKKHFLIFTLLIVGCSKPSFQSALEQVDQGQMKAADRPQCEIDSTEYILAPKILSYDVTSTTGGSFGFNLLSGVFKAFDLKFQLQMAELETTVSVFSPMNFKSAVEPEKNPALVIGDKREKASKGEVKAGIDFSQFFAGVDSYWSTPFSKLTERGLRSSLSAAVEQLGSNPSRWKTVVADITNRFAILPVGLNAGIRENDEFLFYNVTYAWNGSPCSEFLMAVPTTKTPIAKGRVVRVEANAAALELEVLNSQETVSVGTQVEIANLPLGPGETKRSLLRSVKVIDMKPTPIPVNDSSKTVDFSSYANIQFRALLREYGFYVRP